MKNLNHVRMARILILTLGTACITHASAISTDSLILHYTFDENTGATVIDRSGNGNDGIIMNNCIYTDGILGQGLKTVGHSDYSDTGGHVMLPSLDINSMPELTVALWVKEESISSIWGEAYISIGSAPPIEDGRIYIGNATHQDTLLFSGGTYTASIPYTPPYDRDFVHYALTYSSGIMRSYRNGDLIDESSSTLHVENPHLAALGRHWWDGDTATSTRLTAVFDDVRIYNSELTAEEVNTLYEAIPEPASLTLIGLMSGALWFVRRFFTA